MKRLCVQERCPYRGLCALHEDCPIFKSGTPQECIKAYREAKKPKEERTTEDDEQAAVIEYCGLRKIKVVHIPNEGQRSKAYGARLNKLGMQKGFPDLFFPAARQGYHGLFIEMKRDKKSPVRAEQRQWIDYLNGQGYCAVVCYGAQAAIEQIDEYFNKEKGKDE